MPADLHVPDGPATAVAVVLHPHPSMGGDRHHPLVVAIAEGLALRGVAALRPDLTDPDPARSAEALEALAGDLAAEQGTGRILLVGYSWGSVVSTLARPAGLVARVLVAPPAAALEWGPGDGTPSLVLVPAHDQYGGSEPVAEALAGWPGCTIEVVEGTDHFLAGAVDRIASRAVGWAAAR